MKRLLPTLILVPLFGACGISPEPSSFLGASSEKVEHIQDVNYVATRRYTDFVGVVPSTMTERFVRVDDVATVDLLSLNGVLPEAMGDSQRAEFDRLSGMLMRGLGNYVAKMRDFEVRDYELFEANYTWVELEGARTIAGREVRVVEVKPRRLDRPFYTVWMDAETLVTLQYLEYLPTGALASKMEVLDISYDPVSAPSEPVKPSQHDVSMNEVRGLADFDVLTPTYLPEGFVQTSVRLTEQAGSPVVIFSFEDGVQELFMVQYPELQPTPQDGEAVAVGMSAYGATCDAAFSVMGTQFHTTCKLDEEEVMSVIEGLDLLTR